MGMRGKMGKQGRGKSVVLIQITVLVVIVFIISGAICILLFRNSMDRMIEKSKEKLITSQVELMLSTFGYMTGLFNEVQLYRGTMEAIALGDSVQEILNAITNKETSSMQETMNGLLAEQIASGLFDMEANMMITPAIPGILPEPTVIISSDDRFMYAEIPEEIIDLTTLEDEENTPYRSRVDDYNAYILLEDGLPELGLEEEYLITLSRMDPEIMSATDSSTQSFIKQTSFSDAWYVRIKPMHDEIAAIEDYYSEESSHIYKVVGLVVGISLLVLIVITYAVLSVLIRRNITRPMDEISDAAEKVMDGDLEVEIPIKKGEEFEGVKQAFNEMLKSIREIISRSMQG